MRRLSLPTTIVLYLDLWYLLRLASLCAPRSMRTMAMLCRLDPLPPPFDVCRTVLLIEPFRVPIQRLLVVMVAGYGW
ncbi:hypothetical protein Hanom_Chr09g00795681 [Helianthus anomalus]